MSTCVSPCRHHFLIEPPTGPTSKGYCKRCGEQGVFLNSVDVYGPERRVAAHKMYSTAGEKMSMQEAYRE